ncbi:MAG: glycosyltransferase family 4 protein [Gemmatimonadales bacterium]|nr:glycosyltransferase family 4 protein [Gemmatimonadales bacterium]
MRVVFLSHTYVSRLARGKLRALTGLGCTVAVAVPARWRGPGGTGGLVETQWEDDTGIRVVPVTVRGDPSHPDELRWDLRALRRLLKDFRPDVLQVEEEPTSRIAARAAAEARGLRIACVVYTWRTLPGVPSFTQRLRRARVLKRATAIISGNRLADALVVAARPRIPHTVLPQLGVVTPAAASSPGPVLALGFIGRLVPEKGLDMLFRACVRLAGDWTLDIVGTGPAQVELEALAERLGISARLTWHGALPRAELAELWPRIGCIVTPSRALPNWVEAHGRVALEAMAHGIPAVVSDTGALPEAVGEAGLVFPADDVPALTAALQRLIDEPDLRARLGADGRRRIVALFTSEALARRQLEFWRTLASD